MSRTNGKYITRLATMVVDGASAGFITESGDEAVAEIEDLENVSVLFNQIVDGGTATIKVDVSYDGVNWVPAVASKADSDFAAGANMSVVAYTLSDTNGMPLVAKQVRANCTASTAGGSYSCTVVGRQTENFR